MRCAILAGAAIIAGAIVKGFGVAHLVGSYEIILIFVLGFIFVWWDVLEVCHK